MKLIDITNSHNVSGQLTMQIRRCQRYIRGQTTVFYAAPPRYCNLKQKRRIKDVEIEFVVHRLFHMEPEGLDIIKCFNLC